MFVSYYAQTGRLMFVSYYHRQGGWCLYYAITDGGGADVCIILSQTGRLMFVLCYPRQGGWCLYHAVPDGGGGWCLYHIITDREADVCIILSQTGRLIVVSYYHRQGGWYLYHAMSDREADICIMLCQTGRLIFVSYYHRKGDWHLYHVKCECLLETKSVISVRLGWLSRNLFFVFFVGVAALEICNVCYCLKITFLKWLSIHADTYDFQSHPRLGNIAIDSRKLMTVPQFPKLRWPPPA